MKLDASVKFTLTIPRSNNIKLCVCVGGPHSDHCSESQPFESARETYSHRESVFAPTPGSPAATLPAGSDCDLRPCGVFTQGLRCLHHHWGPGTLSHLEGLRGHLGSFRDRLNMFLSLAVVRSNV